MKHSIGRLPKLLQAAMLAVAMVGMTTPISAQGDVIPSSVDVRLVLGDDANHLKIQARSNSTAPFGGVFSALTLTIRYDADAGLQLGSGPVFCDQWSAFPPSPVVINDGIAYRTYNGFGTSRLDDTEFNGGCGMSIPANTWITLKTIPIAGEGCTEFTLGNDDYTDAENRSYYMSMNGWDVTGIVEGGSVTAGACGTDCLGVEGGTALPGTPCDDGDATTTNDTWTADCECVGTPADWDCPDLEANIGDECDDGDANTEDDVVTADCECVGTIVWDCPDLEANIGDECDDGDANTEDDVVTADCECVGTIVWDCPDLEANIGDECDDGDANTEDDVVTADCECVGTIVWDCPDLEANIGDECDDGDANTEDDVVTADCECVGTSIWDCPDLEANIGDECDDNDPATVDDVITEGCECAGDIIDGIDGPHTRDGVSMTVHPNPSMDGHVTLTLDGLGTGHDLVLVTVVDASGKRVYEKTLTAVNGSIQEGMDLSSRVSQGLYAIRVLAGDRYFVSRLVIQ